MLFFKQKTAYEMRISDWSSDVALPICDFFRRRWYVILHQRTHVDAIRRGLGVTRLLGGDRQDLIVIDARRQIDVAGQPPDLAQGFGIVDIAALVLDHQRERQRIAEVRMILEHLHERIVLRQQVREDRLQLPISTAEREENGKE